MASAVLRLRLDRMGALSCRRPSPLPWPDRHPRRAETERLRDELDGSAATVTVIDEDHRVQAMAMGFVELAD